MDARLLPLEEPGNVCSTTQLAHSVVRLSIIPRPVGSLVCPAGTTRCVHVPLVCWAGVQTNLSSWREWGWVDSVATSHQSSSVIWEVGIPVSSNQLLLPILEKHTTGTGLGRRNEKWAHLAVRGNAHARRAARGSAVESEGRDGHSCNIIFL